MKLYDLRTKINEPTKKMAALENGPTAAGEQTRRRSPRLWFWGGANASLWTGRRTETAWSRAFCFASMTLATRYLVSGSGIGGCTWTHHNKSKDLNCSAHDPKTFWWTRQPRRHAFSISSNYIITAIIIGHHT